MATILVVDNDPDVVNLTRAAMALAGHEVITTLDRHKIVPLATAANVAAVVLEVVLPGFSGYDVLRALKASTKTASVPVLIASVMSSGGDRVRGLYEGADDYLSKPFVPLELVLRLERLISQRISAANRPEGEAERLKAALARIEALRGEGRALTDVLLGRYQVTDVLGEGAMGTVFRGWDPRLQRAVALKTIRLVEHIVDGDPSERVHRLLLEAMMVAQISHTNIVAVYDVGHAKDAGFIAMELVEGTSLENLVSGHRGLGPEAAVPLAAGIFRGLAAAHAHRLVHHDVKPGNVLLGTSGSIKLTDFGVAELMSSWAKDSERVFGTPGYLPPEAIRGEGYDEVGDVFSGGVILHQCLTGVRAFTAATVEETLVKTVREPLSPPSRSNAAVSPELDQLVADLTAKHKVQRIQTATEAADRLERIALDRGWKWDARTLQAPMEPDLDEIEDLHARLLPTMRIDTGK